MRKALLIVLSIASILGITLIKDRFRWYYGSLFLSSEQGQEYMKRVKQYALDNPNKKITRRVTDKIITDMGLSVR